MFGFPLCLCMKVIADCSNVMNALGICVVVLVIALVGVNYPIYKKILECGKKKYAQDIIRLAKEISEE